MGQTKIPKVQLDSTIYTAGGSTHVAISDGGTGAATTSQNYAFVGPTSGSGAPSFRALVAGDIPNLTGPITSSGGTTSVASQTGTGATFVMNTSPTLVTPTLGAATATSITFNNNAVTVTSSAGTCSTSYRLNTFTNSSAATMAITLSTSGAVDGQSMIVRIYDHSAVQETIGWTNTENSSVSAPLTSNGSTTAPLTVGFMYNAATSKWRCVAVS